MVNVCECDDTVVRIKLVECTFVCDWRFPTVIWDHPVSVL